MEKEANLKTPCVGVKPAFDMFHAMLLCYACWEGWDRGVFVFGMVVGVAYCLVYSLVGRKFGNVVERMRRALLWNLPGNVVSRFFAHAISFFVYLVFGYFLFLTLVWQTILLYVKVFKT